MVILDTSIVIDHIRQPEDKITLLMQVTEKFSPKDLAISIISIQELYEGKSTKDQGKERELIATISPLKILPYNFEVAQLAGEISRDYPGPIEFQDAAIAATAILNKAFLFTLNKKDFQNIKNLKLT